MEEKIGTRNRNRNRNLGKMARFRNTGSNVTSFDRSRFKDVPLGLFLKFYSAAILYFSQIPLAEYNTKKVAFFVFFGFL